MKWARVTFIISLTPKLVAWSGRSLPILAQTHSCPAAQLPTSFHFSLHSSPLRSSGWSGIRVSTQRGGPSPIYHSSSSALSPPRFFIPKSYPIPSSQICFLRWSWFSFCGLRLLREIQCTDYFPQGLQVDSTFYFIFLIYILS